MNTLRHGSAREWAVGALLLGLAQACSNAPKSDLFAPDAGGTSGVGGSSGVLGSPVVGGSSGALGSPAVGGGRGTSAAAGAANGAAGAVGDDGATRRKFEPPDGRTLLFIGQHISASDEYVTQTGDTPAGFMSYDSLANMEAFQPDHFMYYHHYPLTYPDTAMQLALYMRDNSPSTDNTLQAVLAGGYDDKLDQLAGELKKEYIPVFLRVEYEVNDAFPATHYPAVFKYVKNRLSVVDGLDNVAYVWHVAINGTVNGSNNHFDWYPGDDAVDWIAVSYFEDAVGYLPSGPIDPNVYHDIYQANLKMISDYAVSHHIPLMVAESSPQRNFLPAGGQASWDNWYQKLFGYIDQYDVKALCYINENWPDFGWDVQTFGDSRVQTNSVVFVKWKSAVGGARHGGSALFVHGGSALYPLLRFTP